MRTMILHYQAKISRLALLSARIVDYDFECTKVDAETVDIGIGIVGAVVRFESAE